jgi:hypothetical protein
MLATASRPTGTRFRIVVAQCALSETGRFLMAIHKKILEWQAAHPNITWIGWGIVWAIVFSLLFWPSKGLR